MSSCCWPSASTPGRDGSSSRSVQPIVSEHRDALRRSHRLVVRRPPRARQRDLVRARAGCAIVGPEQGAVHTDLAAVGDQPGGWLAPHVHSFEEALYVLEGELLLDLGGTRPPPRRPATSRSCRPGLRHALGNTAAGPVRLLSLNSPAAAATRRGPEGHVLRARAGPGARWTRRRAGRRSAIRPSGWSATTTGTGPQLEALRVKDPARGRASAGADTAIVAYSGISVKMLVDRTFGADHVTMFTVDYELGGAAQAHDHPFEEAYVFLAGEVEGEFDGQHYTFRPGRRRVRRRRLGPRLLQHRHRTGPLDRDPGAAAAGAAAPIAGSMPMDAVRGGREHVDRRMRRGRRWHDGRSARELARYYAGTGRETDPERPGCATGRGGRGEIGGPARGIALDLAEPKSIRDGAVVGRAGALPRHRRDRARRQYDP